MKKFTIILEIEYNEFLNLPYDFFCYFFELWKC